MAKTSKKAPKAKASSRPAPRKRTGSSKPAAKPARRAVAARKAPPAKTRAARPAATLATRPLASPGGNGSTNSRRPVRNQAGLKAREIEYFRDLLITKRRELLGDVSHMEEEALRHGGNSNLSNLPIHMADMGTDNYEQEFTLGLVEKDRQLLREINTALIKMRDGTYGVCEGTGKPIAKARLEAKPWARYSIEYARQVEKGLVRR